MLVTGLESHIHDLAKNKKSRLYDSSREKEFGTPEESNPPLVRFKGSTSVTSKESAVWYKEMSEPSQIPLAVFKIVEKSLYTRIGLFISGHLS